MKNNFLLIKIFRLFVIYLIFNFIFIHALLKINRVYAWAFITTDSYKEGAAAAIRGDINGEGSGTFFPLVHIAALNCALTSYEINGINGSGYCPENLLAYEGAIPALAKATQGFYAIPPANLAFWIKDTGQTLGFLPQTVNAQGVGFNGLAPLLIIWKAFRNIAYVLVSFAIIVVGFMIMFRRKIDPQTVITIQEAVPRIIIVLIFITFSYAIAGLLIDLMYVILFTAYQVFLASGAIPENVTQTQGTTISFLGIPLAKIRPLLDVILTGDLREAYYIVFPNGMADLFTLASQFFHDGSVSSGNLLQNIVSGFVGGIIGGIIGGFILNIFVIILFLRLFILFLSTYIRIILQVILGPLLMLPSVMPGNNSIEQWVKNTVGNLSVFAVSGIIFMLTIAFYSQTNKAGQAIWVPPYVSIGASLSSLSAFFTLGILFMLPNIAAKVKNTIMQESHHGGGGGGILSGLAGSIQTASAVSHVGGPVINKVAGYVRGKFGKHDDDQYASPGPSPKPNIKSDSGGH